jgi:hypothetical protein
MAFTSVYGKQIKKYYSMIYFYKIYGFCGTASPLILSYGTSFIKKLLTFEPKRVDVPGLICFLI